jgi:hypothetical protein
VPQVGIVEHPAGFFGRDEGAEVEVEGDSAGAIGFWSGKGDPVSSFTERDPEAKMGEHVPIGAHGREDNVQRSAPESSRIALLHRLIPGEQDEWNPQRFYRGSNSRTLSLQPREEFVRQRGYHVAALKG